MGVGGERQAVPAESWQQLVPPDIIPVSLANCKDETCFVEEKRRGAGEGTVETWLIP